MENFYFVQFTDIHIGTIVMPEIVELNLQWALNEVNSFDPAPGNHPLRSVKCPQRN